MVETLGIKKLFRHVFFTSFVIIAGILLGCSTSSSSSISGDSENSRDDVFSGSARISGRVSMYKSDGNELVSRIRPLVK